MSGLLLLLAGGQVSQGAAPDRVSPATLPGLEAFVDGWMAAVLPSNHIAGAAVAVVAGGEVRLLKGYGYANVEHNTPVDPERTLFRIGSITKLFTWTAMMQLVESGDVELDRDISDYLDWKMPATYPQPVTLRSIMTHSAGFEDSNREFVTTDPARIVPLGEWLRRHRPVRVRAPGQLAAYSNWAVALAGYIVERRTGRAWGRVVKDRILEPLGMRHTTVDQPLPVGWRDEMSAGYRWERGRFVPQAWEIATGAAPAGAMAASAADMATFMMLHIRGGELGGRRILADSTSREMQRRQFGHDSRLPGVALGFYERPSHAVRVIGHGGDTQWFHSDLFLLPSEGVGAFVVFNTASGAELTQSRFRDAFLDRYFPAGQEGARVEGDPIGVGDYLPTRRNTSGFERAFSLVSTLAVRAGRDGSLVVGSQARRFVPVDRVLFRNPETGATVAFRVDERGFAEAAFLSVNPVVAYERAVGLGRPANHWPAIALGLVAALFYLGWAGARIVGRTLRSSNALPVRWRSPTALAGLAAALVIAGLALVGVGLADPATILEGPVPPLGFRVGALLPLAGIPPAGLALVAVGSGVRRGCLSRTAAALHVGAIGAMLLMVRSLCYWHVVGRWW